MISAGLTLFWTVIVSHELHNTDFFSSPGDEYRWAGASASYLLDINTINLLAATARRYAPGPATEREITWSPHTSDR